MKWELFFTIEMFSDPWICKQKKFPVQMFYSPFLQINVTVHFMSLERNSYVSF